jgi:hypothetical protein
MEVSLMTTDAQWAYNRLNWAFQEEFNGQLSYGTIIEAVTTISDCSLYNKFIAEYGIPGDWEDSENGSPILIDVGEFIHWVHNNTR